MKEVNKYYLLPEKRFEHLLLMEKNHTCDVPEAENVNATHNELRADSSNDTREHDINDEEFKSNESQKGGESLMGSEGASPSPEMKSPPPPGEPANAKKQPRVLPWLYL